MNFHSIIDHNIRVQIACFADFQFSAKCTFKKKKYKINLTNLVVLNLNCSAHVLYKRKTSNQFLTNSAIEDEISPVHVSCMDWFHREEYFYGETGGISLGREGRK